MQHKHIRKQHTITCMHIHINDPLLVQIPSISNERPIKISYFTHIVQLNAQTHELNIIKNQHNTHTKHQRIDYNGIDFIVVFHHTLWKANLKLNWEIEKRFDFLFFYYKFIFVFILLYFISSFLYCSLLLFLLLLLLMV